MLINEKSKESNNLVSIKVCRDYMTGKVLLILHNHSLDAKKRHSMLHAMGPFRIKVCNRELYCVVAESSSMS